MLARLHAAATGLTADEAAQRLVAQGANESKEGKRVRPLQVLLGQFKSFIIWILIGASVISGELDDGINDAPAMMAATVGMAIGQNHDVTAEAAGVVVMDHALEKVDEFMPISRQPGPVVKAHH